MGKCVDCGTETKDTVYEPNILKRIRYASLVGKRSTTSVSVVDNIISQRELI